MRQKDFGLNEKDCKKKKEKQKQGKNNGIFQDLEIRSFKGRKTLRRLHLLVE